MEIKNNNTEPTIEYLCPRCGEWYIEIEIPEHMVNKHDYPRTRDMRDILRDWSMLGMVMSRISDDTTR